MYTLTVTRVSGRSLVSRITVEQGSMACAADLVTFLADPPSLGAPAGPWSPPACAS
jgi:hypothetical protein